MKCEICKQRINEFPLEGEEKEKVYHIYNKRLIAWLSVCLKCKEDINTREWYYDRKEDKDA